MAYTFAFGRIFIGFTLKIDFTARGQGRVVLRGQGHYETEGFNDGWTSTGVTVDVAEE